MATAISAVKAAKLPPPAPSSPFAELLRRSRFASYDPAIRQTYRAAPANAHRGDWGLKRPISLRRKNAFITLPTFESHAHFTEWNNGESQVRFIRRVEEMDVRPVTRPGSSWDKNSRHTATQWLIDSEFAPDEDHTPTGDASLLPQATEQMTTELAGLGQRGPGQYGAQRQLEGYERQLTPNIEAMSSKEFARYLQKLRQLRPAFQKHIQAHADIEPRLHGQTLFSLAQDPTARYHQRFIEEQTAQEFRDPECRKIAQQPHPNAAMTYHHPSHLDSYFHAKPQPGLVLQENPKSPRYSPHSIEQFYTTSFAGITAVLPRRLAQDRKPLLHLNSQNGVDPNAIAKSTINLRVVPSTLMLDQPPRVVGRNAQGLKGVKIQAAVTSDSQHTSFQRSNPNQPGTTEYNSQAPSVPSGPADFSLLMKKKTNKAPKGSAKNSKHMLNQLGTLLGHGKAGRS
ncbi:hypothetical protein BDN72DRAFT_835839 [Pluteus cervinus]|uniref:Uncharacterized protein n=1 Tax=Pluteus cervinus TaxID=181527 RepID=A0ACD3B373_9AGAR|nr:hypothetical protein BDN72DRAFT_835839 [Pluteus cervinus]